MSERFLPQPRALTTSAINATPRTAGELHLWAAGDALQAADLNSNFLILFGLIANAVALASATDPAIEEIVGAVVEVADKVEHIEDHLGREAKRAQQTAIPLAALASMKRQLDAIEGPLRREAEALHQAVDEEHAHQHALDGRLEALEHAPAPAATKDVHALQQALEAASGDVARLQRELTQLRAAHDELATVRQELQVAADKARQDMLRTTSLLLGRIETLEKMAP